MLTTHEVNQLNKDKLTINQLRVLYERHGIYIPVKGGRLGRAAYREIEIVKGA